MKAIDKETIERAYKIYQEKHGGTIVEISTIFVNVILALNEAAVILDAEEV